MKSIITCLVLVIVASCPVWAEELPDELAGFRLGGNIADFEHLVRMETQLPLRFSPFIREIETAYIPGYRYGLIWVTQCGSPGRIARIKMKYMDGSKAFFEELFRRIKKRFGEPDEWRGDPFHVVIAWKWSFRDQAGNKISMYLEHNTGDRTESKGNSLKLTLWSLVDAEKACHRHRMAADACPPSLIPEKPDWDLLVPR